jgi:N-carbamoyl-L-amino-acid hydrolase
MIASGVFAGLFEKKHAYSITDSEGLSLEQELNRIHYMGTEICGDHPMGALLEAHIEQGPILEREHDQVGIVIGGQGQRWFDVNLMGQDSHAGSTPMAGRRDALVAAAALIQLVQEIALSKAPFGVGTVGEMKVVPSSRNTIPGEVFLTVEFRHPDDSILLTMANEFIQFCEHTSSKTDVKIKPVEIWHNPPVRFDEMCIDAVDRAAQSLGYKNQKMISGAGHDAIQVSRKVPSAMIFVPCEAGLSHNESENAKPEDLEAGCNVLLHAMLDLAKNHE